MGNCKNLEFVPNNIYNLRHTVLLFGNCSKLENLPPLSTDLLFLTHLYLSNTNISEIPTSTKCTQLHYLYISYCKFLQSLPELPSSISGVDAYGCISLEIVSNTLVDAFTAQAPWNHEDYYAENFTFSDCLKLDENSIITEFHIRALRLATGLVVRPKESKVDQVYLLSLLL